MNMDIKKTPEEIQASLAAPGAGIPFYERWMGRFLLKPLIMRRTPWDVSETRFQKIHEKFKRDLAKVPADRLTERVLVLPQSGLEDSSRFWSAAMCSRHLFIVGTQMEQVVVKLSRREPINRQASTAAVKPEVAHNTPDSVNEYITFGDSLIDRLRASVDDRESSQTFSHPWFGPMRAKEWMFLFSAHTSVHLQQLRAILDEISGTR